jgi:hypothetical protein
MNIPQLYLVEPYNAYAPKGQKKHWMQVVEEQALMARIMADQQALQESQYSKTLPENAPASATPTIGGIPQAGGGGQPVPQFFNQNLTLSKPVAPTVVVPPVAPISAPVVIASPIVKDTPISAPVAAAFTVSDLTTPITLTNGYYTASVGDVIQFTDASSNAITWKWNFGSESDSMSEDQDPMFTYTSASVYTVTLDVTDSVGHKSTGVRNIKIV